MIADAVRSIIRSPVKTGQHTRAPQHHSDFDLDLEGDTAPVVTRQLPTNIFPDDEDDSDDTDYEEELNIDWAS